MNAFLRRILCVAVLGAVAVTSAAASDLPVRPNRVPDYYNDDGKPQWTPEFVPAPPLPMWQAEFGARYWLASGTTQTDLYGPAPSTLQISRLTFSGLHSHVGEIFGRVEHATGVFVKGFAGLGKVNAGKLQDEDFPPVVVPYSSTDSDQRDGRRQYASIDVGWNLRVPALSLGVFVGYLYYFEKLNAFGCTQTGGNPDICVPAIPNSVLVITQEVTWNAVRLGVSGEFRFRNGLRVNGEIAWLPYAVLNGKDFHWLRIPSDFSGPTPERGSTPMHVQIELLVAYDFSNAFSVGVGGRYWSIGTGSNGATAHFEQSTASGVPQSLALRTEMWGGFIQASYKFGQLLPSSPNMRRSPLF